MPIADALDLDHRNNVPDVEIRSEAPAQQEFLHCHQSISH